MPDYTIETRDDGVRWLVPHRWSRRMSELVASGAADGVELNASKGSWPGGLAFLREVPDLRHLVVIDLQEESVAALQMLTRLETLTLIAYAKTPLDLAEFGRLTKAAIEWRSQYRNLSACTRLIELSLNQYSGTDLSVLAPLKRL